MQERAAAAAAAAAPGGAAEEESEDDDDDEAMLARKRQSGAPAFAYALDPAERDRLEKAEAAALREKRAAAAAAEAAKAADAAAKAAAEAEAKMRSASIKEARADAGVAWAFAAGTLVKAPPGTPLPPGAGGKGAGRGTGAPDIFDVWVEVSSLVVGRIIGQGGATIKEITARSGARVSVDNAVTPGMSLLHAVGRPEALESARMLINNAMAPRAAR